MSESSPHSLTSSKCCPCRHSNVIFGHICYACVWLSLPYKATAVQAQNDELRQRIATVEAGVSEQIAAVESSKSKELVALEKKKAEELVALEKKKAEEVVALEKKKAEELVALEKKKAEELAAVEKNLSVRIADLEKSKQELVTELQSAKVIEQCKTCHVIVMCHSYLRHGTLPVSLSLFVDITVLLTCLTFLSVGTDLSFQPGA